MRSTKEPLKAIQKPTTSPFNMELTKRDLRHIEKLVPEMRDKATRFLVHATRYLQNVDEKLCTDFDWRKSRMRITDSIREPILQAGMYSQGRIWDKDKRKWKDDPNEDRVTWTMNSKHIWGKAFDATPFVGRTPYWPDKEHPANRRVYLALHNIGNTLGLRTIGLWVAPHYEI